MGPEKAPHNLRAPSIFSGTPYTCYCGITHFYYSLEHMLSDEHTNALASKRSVFYYDKFRNDLRKDYLKKYPNAFKY